MEYKKSGWKLSGDRNKVAFTDKNKIGTLKLIGTYDLHFYQIEQIQRVRLVKRADGYYCQFCIQVDVKETLEPTSKTIGLDVGFASFYTDSNGEKVDNPRHLRKSEKKRCVVMYSDIVAYEDLKVRNMVKNRRLAKSISDAAWSQFREWLQYLALKFGRVVVPVPPHYTSQNCSNCGETVKKSLSVRTHACKCGAVLDRDENAARNILIKALQILDYISNTLGYSEINACGETILYLNLETVSKQDCSVKQESPVTAQA